MRSAVNHIAGLVAACVFALAYAAPAFAEDRPPEGRGVEESAGPKRPWAASLAFLSGVTVHEHASTSQSTCQLGGDGDPDRGIATCNFLVNFIPANLRPPQSGTDIAVSPFVGVNLELMSGTLEVLPLAPRVFVSGEVIFTFGSVRNIANEGNPTRVGLPSTFDPDEITSVSTALLAGVGSRTSSEYETYGYGAGIGMAFPFEFRGRQLWLKPSFVWIRQELSIEGLVVAGLKNDRATGPPFGDQFREIILRGSENLVLDGIGPGLEIEMEVGHFGPIGATLFGNVNAYRVLGNRRVIMTDSNSTLPGIQPGLFPDVYDARWTFTARPWLFRSALGIRFQWLGR